MGMFDTIQLDPPLVCPACGHAEATLQTHHFAETLDTYRVGMIVRDCPVLTGILRETFWCSACHNTEPGRAPELFVVIWNAILVAVEWTQDDAERKLGAVDRVSLIEWLDRMQREAREWRRRYHALRTDLERWHRYATERKTDGNEEPEPAAAWRKLFMPDETIRNAPDPLQAILERHAPVEAPEWC